MIGDDKEVAQGRTRDGMRWRVTVEILERNEDERSDILGRCISIERLNVPAELRTLPAMPPINWFGNYHREHAPTETQKRKARQELRNRTARRYTRYF
jgi:hypothetical protein